MGWFRQLGACSDRHVQQIGDVLTALSSDPPRGDGTLTPLKIMTKRIVVLVKKLLAGRYGAAGLQELIDAAKPLASADLLLSNATTAVGIRADLQKLLTDHDDASVLLVGGVSTLPFFELTPNPMGDADQSIESDNPYGVPGTSVALADICLPTVSVGRIPDHPQDTSTTFASRIVRLCSVQSAERNPASSYLLSTVSWKTTSSEIATAAGLSPAVDVAPPRSPTGFGGENGPVAPETTHLLFNLHGSDRNTPWYGETANRASQPEAFDVVSVDQISLASLVSDRVFVSQACYGAFLRNRQGERTPANGVCLKILEKGAAAFVGSTTIAYGRTTGGMACSDVLVAEFLRIVCTGYSFGAALIRARKAVAATGANPPTGALMKTLVQFVLYGDPASEWSTSTGLVEKTLLDVPDFGAYGSWIPGSVEEKDSPQEDGDSGSNGGSSGWVPVRTFSAPWMVAGPIHAKASGHRRDLMFSVRFRRYPRRECRNRSPISESEWSTVMDVSMTSRARAVSRCRPLSKCPRPRLLLLRRRSLRRGGVHRSPKR